jgi:hypothetical protein
MCAPYFSAGRQPAHGRAAAHGRSGTARLAPQKQRQLVGDPLASRVLVVGLERLRGVPDVLRDVDEVDHDRAGDATTLRLGHDQVELVLGAVDEHDPAFVVLGVAALHLVERLAHDRRHRLAHARRHALGLRLGPPLLRRLRLRFVDARTGPGSRRMSCG